jgi:tRNA pseudouridine38-40 synthase
MIGEHDFTSFTKGNEEKESFVRNIYSINIENINDIISITFCGSGFLRYMVRNMVGSLIEVGNGLRKPKDIQKILRAKDRTKAGITAPACGLYLSNVFYKN